MKKSPNLITVNGLLETAVTTSRQISDGRWVPARPLGWYSFWMRLKLAWGVFTGRYDALEWEEQ